MATNNDETNAAKKPYEKPAITHVEKIETRAAVCSRSNDATCGSGPILS